MTVRKTRAKKASAKKKAQTVSAKAGHASTAPHKRSKSSRTVAEARGLAQRDAVISAKPIEGSASGSLTDTAGSLIDQQFRVWSAMMRMSPLPFVLQQQAVFAKLLMGFMLPGKSGRKSGR
jgi:hypothetical protein